ncbi:NTF2 fold immunity protein [Epilithonimonas hominis]|uniref:NTF2 fold immunity protein n=1 Tax=Epilithonimonas hominis TaxID=420404 RepID=A0A1H6HWP6_9FLAO|nr:NTF2 fold immunity protein [Epilithonimonas hominis]
MNNETFSEQGSNYPPKPINEAKNAVDIAEDILFNTYGEKNIKRQRPYNLVFQDSYWIINGTKKKAEIGGVFLIILNSKNGKIIKITHGE